MRPEEIKARLIEEAKRLHIDKIGFASADPFLELKERLVEHRRKGYESGFEEPDLEKRTHPEKILPQAKSLIAIALAYPSRLPNPPKSKPGAYRGIFCRASWGRDYHHVLRERLEALKACLLAMVPDTSVEILVDTGPLSDRAVAERAGIGWVGKNTALITEEFGSWVYLGEMITDVYLPPDTPVTEGCGDCTACLDACPTGALVQPGQLNAQDCLAYLTQTKQLVPEPFREKIGNRLYGCDTCQVVCPYNRKVNFTHQREFAPDPEKVKPLLKPILGLSNRQFRREFGEMAGSWRGKGPIQRNAIIALAHFRDPSAVPLLTRLLREDPRPMIRGTSAWALGKIGGEEARAALCAAEQEEKDVDVRQEVKRALSRIQEGVGSAPSAHGGEGGS